MHGFGMAVAVILAVSAGSALACSHQQNARASTVVTTGDAGQSEPQPATTTTTTTVKKTTGG